MKITILFSCIFFVFGNSLNAKEQKTVGAKSHMLLNIVESIHCGGDSLTDEDSQAVIRLFIKSMDPFSNYLIDTDIKGFHQFDSKLEKDISTYSDSICSLAKTIYKLRLTEADSLLEIIQTQHFDFEEDDSLSFAKEYTEKYVSNQEGLVTRWRQLIKLRVLSHIASSDTDLINIVDQPNHSLLKNQNQIIHQVSTKFKQEIHNILDHPEGFNQHIESLFLRSLAESFDPHTTYFSENDQMQFNQSLSKDNKGYGVSSHDNMQGEIVISHIEIGSSAWKSEAFE